MLLFVFVISIVQGITEFLPISSSGHLILVYKAFGISGETQLLSIILHLATLLSVVVYYRKDILDLIKNPFCKTNKLLICSTIPTVLFVLVFKKLIDNSFSGNLILFGFIITALTLAIADFLSENNNKVSKSGQYFTETSLMTNFNDSEKNIKSRNTNVDYEKIKQREIEPSRNNITIKTKQKTLPDICSLPITYTQSIILGLAQGVACFPAISRSGSTISAGLMLKLDKETATKYSFLMSIPIIIASLFYEIIFPPTNAFSISPILIILALIITAVVGFFSIKLVSKVVQKSKLSYFSYYLLLLVFVISLTKIIIRFV